ncbi:unnamed protein product [Schistosoma mattheei]|uniref:Uncharacterized protein n=1 Tax=Schistosoma mattheei TaxID=31246 RepID=A0A183PDI7_9TREM|nr:unnamed protein product [Schistosoma mattheei]
MSSLRHIGLHSSVDLPGQQHSTSSRHMGRSTPALQRPAESSTCDFRQGSSRPITPLRRQHPPKPTPLRQNTPPNVTPPHQTAPLAIQRQALNSDHRTAPFLSSDCQRHRM